MITWIPTIPEATEIRPVGKMLEKIAKKCQSKRFRLPMKPFSDMLIL